MTFNFFTDLFAHLESPKFIFPLCCGICAQGLSVVACAQEQPKAPMWSTWTQWGGTSVNGHSGYEVILGAVAACEKLRASCRLGELLEEKIVSTPAGWSHYIKYRTYVDNGTGVELETSEAAARRCTDKELIELDDCKIIKRCGAPFILNVQAEVCEAYCATSETWDPTTERCIPPPQEQSCKTQGKYPIDFIEGRKYRSESVLNSGLRYPFSLTYYFNNHRNQEKTPVASKIAVVNGDRYLVATKPAMTASEYQVIYTNRGVPKGGTVYREGQHYGSVEQYWRHNFDDVLAVQGSQYLYQSAKGEEIVFDGFGNSTAYPSLALETLASGEETFGGYKLTNRLSREVRKFDQNGRLIKLERSPQDVLTLTYDSQNRLERITNSEGAYIQLIYQSLVTDSIYSNTSTSHSYLISATNNRGESAQITWAKSYQGKSAKFHLITQITEASSGAEQSARTFEYNDARWPASITDQYFVADINNSAHKKQILHFDYDELGRAIFSGLNSQPSDTVTYVDANTRVVTNALGKQATYTFADFDGVKRVQSVTGEPTQNCVSSEVSYDYDANGNVSHKIQNGQVTEYQYDGQNREIFRTEAAGTPEVRTITTEYHSTLNLPVRITEPGRIQVMTYDESGRLLSKDIQSTTAPSP